MAREARGSKKDASVLARFGREPRFLGDSLNYLPKDVQQ